MSGKRSKNSEDEDRDIIVVEIGPEFRLESSQADGENPEILA
jgi:hypothetical protein